MAKLHHNTLKAAVAKYKPLLDEGQSEEDIRAAIADDQEKKFDPDEVDLIYAAIVAPPADAQPTEVAYMVDKEFRDVSDFSKVHTEGTDVSHFPKDRLEKLIKNGHVGIYKK